MLLNESVLRSYKGLRVGLVVLLVLGVSGCELLPKALQPKQEQEPVVEVVKEAPESKALLCDNPEQVNQFGKWCDIESFLTYTLEISELNWPERKLIINELGDSNGELIQRILLSQGTSTPYTDRLRAQNWIVKMYPMASEYMALLLNKIIYENSKQLLEFESAITILSRVNARQEKVITELRELLTQKEEQIKVQQNQVEQLLKIESDLVEQNRNEQR